MSNRDSRNHRFHRGGLHRDRDRYHPYSRPPHQSSHRHHDRPQQHHPQQDGSSHSTDGRFRHRGSPGRYGGPSRGDRGGGWDRRSGGRWHGSRSASYVPPPPPLLPQEFWKTEYWMDKESLEKQLKIVFEHDRNKNPLNLAVHAFADKMTERMAKARDKTKADVRANPNRFGPEDPAAFDPFIDALCYCSPMMFGFFCTVDLESNFCTCPCSRKMLIWQQSFRLEQSLQTDVGGDCTTKGSNPRRTPDQLLDHLRSKKDSIMNSSERNNILFHDIVYRFLDCFFDDFNWGMKHKAFYPRQSADYKMVERRTNHHIILLIRSGKEEIERLRKEEEKTIQEAKDKEWMMKKLEETNKNRYNILKQKEELNEKGKKLVGRLGGTNDVLHAPSAQEMAIAYSLWKERAVRLRREKGAGELNKLKIKIELDQHINSIFDKLTEGGRGILATDGPFSLVCGLEVSSKHSEAKDEGGPTRQFLSMIWKQLTELSVQDRNLFEQEKGYLKVALDSQLNKLENYATVKSYYKAIGKLFAFCALHQYQISEQVLPDPYRYYLFHGWTPMDSCYPLPLLLDSFFKIFCEKNQDEKVEQLVRAGDIEDLVSVVAGWKMTDFNEKVREILRVAEEGEQAIRIEEKEIREKALEQFKREEYTNLLRQWAMDINFKEEEPEEGPSTNPKESLVENDQENIVEDLEKATGESANSRIRKVIYDFTIDQRLQNLECIREGMCLGGQKQDTSIDEQVTCIDELRSLFHNMPIGSMERLLFARPVFDTDTVIQSLRACYIGPDELQATQRLVLKRVNDSWRGVLVDSIRRNAEVDSDFLRKFVFFVTGYEYQPSATVLQIKVEFNPVEMNYDSCPVAHTCDPTLKLPGNAYDANEELLTEMLLISINATAGTFGLR